MKKCQKSFEIDVVVSNLGPNILHTHLVIWVPQEVKSLNVFDDLS
jgi:hypothetical protein